MGARKFVVGLLFVLLAGAITLLATAGVPKLRPGPVEVAPTLQFLSNHPELPTHIGVIVLPGSDTKYANVYLTINLRYASRPADYRWALLGTQGWSFTIVDDDGRRPNGLAGRWNPQSFTGQKMCSTGPKSSEWVIYNDCGLVVGNSTEAWIPGMSRTVSIERGEIQFPVRVDIGRLRKNFIDSYTYELGLVGTQREPGTGESGYRYDVPDVGWVETGSQEKFEVSLTADSERDRVAFASSSGSGEGRVSWNDPTGALRVTFESTAAKTRNTAMLFIAGLLAAIGTGFWVSGVAVTKPHH